MASKHEYLDFVLEQLSDLPDVTYRPMMGEYLLYWQGVLFGGIYDNRLLLKRNHNNVQLNLTEALPYPGAKPMYLVTDVENRDELQAAVRLTIAGIKNVGKN